jgi:GPH family glycoside/pentoside/hexuronide:cation symporter
MSSIAATAQVSQPKRVSTSKIVGYALGEGAISITMNGISNFAMLYYTLVLGLGAGYVGIALSVTTLWDAITDPVMGYLTDNTQSRWGRRFPYILLGGLLLSISFLLLWILPAQFTSASGIFWCMLLTNLVVRTSSTVFIVPYTALGFEICPNYVDRARLQGIRYFLNQCVNLVFGAFAWIIFFQDRTAIDGSRIDGTSIASNYNNMAITLSIASFLLILFCMYSIRDYATDNRSTATIGHSFTSFKNVMVEILSDNLARFVFVFLAISKLAMLFVAQIQIFTYVLFMEFSAMEKTVVHGGTMIAFALGALFLPQLVKRFDKKTTAYIAIWISTIGSLGLLIVFSGNLIKPDAIWNITNYELPIGRMIFAPLHWMWWGGCGILVPLATSMIADISEINARKTGVLKDGSYAAIFSFVAKASNSLGLLFTGSLVALAGVVAGSDTQTQEAVKNVAWITFLSGPIIMIFGLWALQKYPVDKAFMSRT